MTDNNKENDNNFEENQSASSLQNNQNNFGLKQNESAFTNLYYKIILTIVFIVCFIALMKIIPIILFKTIETKNQDWFVLKMSKPRSVATANTLYDGNVLIIGGYPDSVDTADIYNPKNKKIIKTIPLDDKRFVGFSTLEMQDGNILITGGGDYDKAVLKKYNTAKIFDVASYTFKDISNMPYYTVFHKSVLLQNGNVLFLHGLGTRCGDYCTYLSDAKYQIYNPNENKFYFTKNYCTTVATKPIDFMLENGNVLLFDFSNNQCLYDVKSNMFERVYNKYPVGWYRIQIDSQNYLALEPEDTYSFGYIYNIVSNTRKEVDNVIPRTWRTGTKLMIKKLKDGNIFIMGINAKSIEGEQGTNRRDAKSKNIRLNKYSVYLYNKQINKFIELPAPPYPVYDAGITQLLNGDILVAGGYYRDKKKGFTYSDKIQIYKYSQ